VSNPNLKSSSLAGRVALALTLMAGFYLLALAIVGLLLFVVYLEIASGRLNIYLTIICLFAAGVILWSIIPRPQRFDAPGPLLKPDQNPRLFAELKSISSAVSQNLPSEVYLLPDANAYVAQRGGFLGLGCRRIIGIGLPLLSVLTVSQLRSVLAHEFGHYYGGDTRLGPLIFRTRIMVIRTVSGLHADNTFFYLIRLPFYGYGKMFLRITQAVSRSQEYSADRLAARLAGSANTITALRNIHGIGPAWDSYWRSEYAPILSSGFVPPLASGFKRFLQSKNVAEKVTEIIEKQSKESKTNPYDSHPSLKDRIAALESLPSGQEISEDAPAISLLDNIPPLEMGLLQPIADRNNISGLKTAGWDEIAALVYIPSWERALRQRENLLKGLTPEELAEAAGKSDLLLNRLAGAENLNEQDRLGLLNRTIGAALTLALLQRGWKVKTAPGDPVYVYRGKQKFEPFEIYQRLQSAALPPEVWQQTCRSLGIAAVDLSTVIPKAG
jgi:heat shock protein HtpX